MPRNSLDAGPPEDVELLPSADRWTLVFVKDLRHPPEKVWAALTEPDRLREWAPYTADRTLARPGDATLTMIDGDRSQDLPASVSRSEPPTLLEYSWGTDQLRWELTTTGEGTRLTLRHTLADRGSAPKAAAGWHLCLLVAERLLDGEPVRPIRGQQAREHGWDELHDAYVAKLGLEGTGGPAGS
jgi:uncharacterized protein YndB with AHSA1/START domain